ncbi:AGE family epimerase/isomerase [Brachybacterium massiliense]|uniref:AGE family epimerase/isomerase n=1 Tax=Brachybacterium massiliense TaxID=1755098 RepID=UPI000B3BBB10|nr:AGE family epimerase/isomerase [Brachybacterium massiliense]
MRDSLRTHLERDVLAWWSRHGADDELGGVRTCFTNRGQLRTTEKYTWSQGRWAWTCALIVEEIDAGRLQGDRDLWHRRALRTADFLAEHAFLPDSRTAFLLSARGEPIADAQGELATSVFADLFAVLGLAGALRLTDSAAESSSSREPSRPDTAAASASDPARWLAQAERTLRGAADSLHHRTARSEPYPVSAGFRDLAGPMTLLHVAAELHRATGSALAADVMTEARAVLLGGESAFLGPETWWEHRPDDPADHDTLLARHVTPGHLLELLWMLVHVGDLHPQLAVPDGTLTVLALRALETGWDQAEGGLLRYVDRDTGAAPDGRELGTPYESLVHRTWDTKLWWVHAETLYATALLARRTGSPEIARWAEQVREYTMATFPDPGGQEWIQIRSRDGSPLDEVVALPVKDPMHIARSLLLLNALEAGGEP